jgi:hypothetical protein
MYRILRTLLPLVLIPAVYSCRSAGQSLTLRDCTHVHITIVAETDAEQGKTFPFDVYTDAEIPVR